MSIICIYSSYYFLFVDHLFKLKKSKKNKKSEKSDKKTISASQLSQSQSTTSMSQSPNPFEDDEDNLINDCEYLLEEEIIPDIIQLLQQLYSLLNPEVPKLTLNKYSDMITFIVESLIEITRTQQDKIEEQNTPAAISYTILNCLLNNIHGKCEYNFNVMLKHLLVSQLIETILLLTHQYNVNILFLSFLFFVAKYIDDICRFSNIKCTKIFNLYTYTCITIYYVN